LSHTKAFDTVSREPEQAAALVAKAGNTRPYLPAIESRSAIRITRKPAPEAGFVFWCYA